MPVIELVPENAEYFRERINRLQPDSERQFGTMNVVEMMRHMRNATETALGEVENPGKPNPIVGRLLFLFICYVMTEWPKGKIKAPDYWTPPPDRDFDEEKKALLEAFERFMAKMEAGETETVTEHPMLGKLNLKQWSRLNGIHFIHHFKQFDVN